MYHNAEKPSNLENNCGQVFAKESTLTKQLKGQLQNSEILPSKIVMCGCRFKPRQLLVLAVLGLLFFVSFMGVVIMWWTSCFDNYVLSHLVLLNGTASFALWKDPPLKPTMSIHIFNYTNADEYERGEADKLHVEDVGPYVYDESLHKINIKFYPNDTISYQEFRTHAFRPDLSKNRKETDRIVVPNLSLLSTAAVSQESFFVTRIAVSALLRGLNADPFLNLAANRFLWGYDDRVFELGKTFMSFQTKLPMESMGVMAVRNGTSDDIITVYSGKNDYSKIGQIERVNGQNDMQHWSTKDCNQIKGSDGALYPIYELRQKMPVSMYYKEVCRRIPMVYQEDVRILDGQIPAYRYTIADAMFSQPDTVPENTCYCDGGTCSPRGLFNISKCAFGAPAFLSLPHFYKGDPALLKGVTGLKPDPEKHSSHIDIHPTLAFPMNAVYRLQFSMQVKKSTGMSQLDMFEDNVFLPIAWIEAGVDVHDLPDSAREAILTASITLPMIEKLLKYGFLLMFIISFACISLIIICKFNERAKQQQNYKITYVYS